jgi:hypothetical protein
MQKINFMKLSADQLIWILDALTSLAPNRHFTIDGVPDPKEIDTISKKTKEALDRVKSPNSFADLELSEREKWIFVNAAREILAEKHFAYSELPAVATADKGTLLNRWAEVAQLLGYEL